MAASNSRSPQELNKGANSGSGEELQVEAQLAENDQEMAPPDVPEDDADAEGEVDGNEEEYEIEEILDSKRQMFGSRMGYLVKWKGYSENDNSWVDEEDAAGAQELIREYWEKKGKKGPRAKSLSKPSRPSTARNSNASADNAKAKKATPAKRGLAAEESEQEGAGAAKKSRKSTDDIPNLAASDDEIGDIKDASALRELSSRKNWDKMISHIDTVERTAEGALVVYFTLNNGTRCKEHAILCRQKLPSKLFDFYEQSLRWRESSVVE